MYQIYASNSGWVLGTDYTLDVEVTSAGNQVRTVAGWLSRPGTERGQDSSDSCIFVVGDTAGGYGYADGKSSPLSKTATAKDPHHKRQSLRQLQGWRNGHFQRAGEAHHHSGHADQVLCVLLR